MTKHEWFGKRAGPNVQPLTSAWLTSATQPRYHPDGTVTFVLTPPRKPATNPWFIAFVAIILFSAACAPWIIFTVGK